MKLLSVYLSFNMYTSEIKSRTNGIATVVFSNGDTETYTEQVIVSEAQFATEETPFIPPVYEIIEHERPKLLSFSFKDDVTLDVRIQDKLDELNNVVKEPTPEELAAQEATRIAFQEQAEFETAKADWLQKKQALTTMIDDMERGSKLGITPDETQVAIMQELATWVNTNMDRRYYF